MMRVIEEIIGLGRFAKPVAGNGELSEAARVEEVGRHAVVAEVRPLPDAEGQTSKQPLDVAPAGVVDDRA
jgi:hypothetical protein